MFDNPEKLFIILLIALFIFGPQKLIGLGTAMGRAVRDFRGAVRNAQEEFRAAADEVHRAEESLTAPEPAAVPAPEPIPQAAPMPDTAVPAVTPAASDPAAVHPAEPASDHEGPHSLASEPPAHAVQESLTRKE